MATTEQKDIYRRRTVGRRNILLGLTAAAAATTAYFVNPNMAEALLASRSKKERGYRLDLRENIYMGANFLLDRFDENDGLLRASSSTEADICYINTDNFLAVRALKAAGVEDSRIGIIENTINILGNPPHGVIEIIDGNVMPWPPHGSKTDPITSTIKTESRPFTEGTMNDWTDYTDLTLWGALNSINQGDIREAMKRYQLAMAKYTRFGFADIVQTSDREGRFTTYKLPLAIMVGDLLNVAPNTEMVDLLLSMQNSDGGFVSLSTPENGPIGDANVETTSLSMLALTRLQNQFG